jgi:diguanylate cyclase (GGDEF)-like protein
MEHPVTTTSAAGTAATDAEARARADRIDLALLLLAFRHNPATLSVNLAAAAAVTGLLAGSQGAWVWAWLGLVTVAAAVRLGIHRAYTRRGREEAERDPAARHAWQRTHELGLLAGAAMWAVLAVRALPGEDAEGRFTILIVMAALAAGATGLLAPLAGAARAYIGLLLVVPSACLVLVPDPEPVLASLGLVFFVMMLIGHRSNRQVLVRSIALQEENASLVGSLRAQNDRVVELNASLERRVAERTAALETMAHRDALTGLYNRRGLLAWIEQKLEDTERGVTSLLFLDLDRFKQINDGRGHDVGDALLRAVARRFEAAVPHRTVVGRWGGDEFVVVMRTGAGEEPAARVAAALHEALAEPIDVNGEPLQVGVSIGVAVHPRDGATATALIRAADLAATEVKRTGRGDTRHYQRTLSEIQRRRLEIGLGLRDAMERGSLRLAYQPIVDARTGRIASLEALLRWHHPELGPVEPGEFIPIAEESDRIVELGAWVLGRSCLEAATWGAVGDPPRVAVNVSVRQLLGTGLVDALRAALDTSGLDPARLELEVTESVFDAKHTATTLETLEAAHDLGVRVHVDDFGAGYSSLSRLHDFPIDAIKIDRSFVANLDGAGRTIVEGTMMIARRFGLGVVAEGVETPDQAAALAAMGVDALQGFWLGRPETAPRTLALLPTWLDQAARHAVAG